MFFAASVRAVCVPDQEHARRKRRYIFFWGAASIGRRLASFWPSLLGRNGACPPLPFVAPLLLHVAALLGRMEGRPFVARCRPPSGFMLAALLGCMEGRPFVVASCRPSPLSIQTK